MSHNVTQVTTQSAAQCSKVISSDSGEGVGGGPGVVAASEAASVVTTIAGKSTRRE